MGINLAKLDLVCLKIKKYRNFIYTLKFKSIIH